MLIRNAALISGRPVDIRVDTHIREVAPQLIATRGEDVLDAGGGWVIPGLHDHHVHLRAAAAALACTAVGPQHARSAANLSRLLHAAPVGQDGWIRAVGYHDSVAGPLDRHTVDALGPELPIRIQHRSGAMWILNSAGLQQLGRADHPDGRFLRGAEDLALPPNTPEFGTLSARLSQLGVTGVTDATPGQCPADIEALAAATQSGEIRQRVHCMAPAEQPTVPGVTLGPTKFILDDHTLDLDDLTARITQVHSRNHPVAVHAVTVAQLVVTMAALQAAGTHPGDRIEHAAVVPADCVADLAALQVTVVTQPNFIGERGDEYLVDIPDDEHDQLWRVATLDNAGVSVALSTDAPFGAPDPWAAMRSAVQRTTSSGSVIGAAERISAQHAVQKFCGHSRDPARSRLIEPGQLADLCVLAAPPSQVLAELDADLVAATLVGGVPIYVA